MKCKLIILGFWTAICICAWLITPAGSTCSTGINKTHLDPAPGAFVDNQTIEINSTNGLQVKPIDEDDMASNSAVKVPSQQSVKKYVDDQIAINKVSVYDSGWFAVTVNTSYVKTHNLGTKVIFQLQFSTSTDGTNAKIVDWFYDHSHGDFTYGIGGQVIDITSTQCTVRTGHNFLAYDAVLGFNYYTSGYYRLLVFSLAG